MHSLNCFITTSYFILIRYKIWRKWSQQVLLCADLASHRQDQRQWKWHKMVEVTDAYKQGMYGTIWENGLHVMSNVKVFATQDSQPAEHDSLHRFMWCSYGSIITIIIITTTKIVMIMMMIMIIITTCLNKDKFKLSGNDRSESKEILCQKKMGTSQWQLLINNCETSTTTDNGEIICS